MAMAVPESSSDQMDVFDDFFDDVLSSQQTAVDEAEGLRESSDSESDALTEPTAWWARMLKEHTAGLEVPEQARQLNLLSGCTGLCAEAEVLKAGFASVSHSLSRLVG